MSKCKSKYDLCIEYAKAEIAQYVSPKQPPANISTVAGSINYITPYLTASSLACKSVPVAISTDSYCNKQEGNNPMNYATATVQAGTTETQDQRKYLSNRLDEVYYTQLRPLEAKFGLTDDRPPSTPKELKERIESGKFTIVGLPKDDEDDEDECYFYGSWSRMLKWRDPAKKADHDGYEAATKELRDLKQKTLDIIKIDEPKAGLDAIKALEAWTPTGASN